MDGQVKANTDGASQGSPGLAGVGISFRDRTGTFLYVKARGLGEAKTFCSVCVAIILAAEIAVKKDWHNL